MAFNIMDLFGGDINKILTATQMAMRSTDLGRGGVVKADVNAAGAIEFIINATGETFSDPQSAFVEASTKMITQYERVLPTAGGIGDITNNPRRAQMGAVLQAMQDRFNQLKTSGDRAFIDFLSRAGIADDDLSFGLIGSQEARGKNITRALTGLESSIGGFIPLIDDEGIDILQLMVGGKSLKKADMFMLMSFLGNDIASLSKITKAFGIHGTSEDIESYLAKLGKRVRGISADRDITFMAEDIIDIFGAIDKHGRNVRAAIGRGEAVDIGDSFGVVIEEGLDTFRKAMKVQARGKHLRTAPIGIGGSTSITHISTIMAERDERLIIESGLRSAGYTKTYDEYLEELKAAGVSDIIATAETNKELLDRAKSVLSDDQYKVLEKVMGAAEKEFDGAGVFNQRLINGARSKLENEISDIKAKIASGIIPDSQEIREKLLQLEQQKKIVSNAKNLYQVTGRGSVEDEGIKTAFEVLDLRSALGSDFDNVAYIIGRSGLKGDIGLASGTNMIALSGLGTPRELVYTDPVTAAFHPEIFASPQELESIQAYSAEILSDFEEAVNTNTLPKQVKRMLETVADEDYSSLPIPMQRSRIRNQEFARQILQLHQSGVGPKESPQMMNMLHSFMASEMYTVRTKTRATGEVVSTFLPVSPNTYRFAVGSESTLFGKAAILDEYVGSVGATAGRKGFQTIAYDLEGAAVNADLLKFRVSNHRMLFAAGAIEEFYHALGGFDLDDKGLPKLMTASKKNADGTLSKNLIFSITRQPSGHKEIIYGSAALTDGETLKHLFGNERFKQTLSLMRAEGGLDETLEDLFQVLNGSKTKLDPTRTEQDVTEAILKVYQRRGSKIAEAEERVLGHISKYGSSPFRYSDVISEADIGDTGLYRITKAKLEDAVALGADAEATYIRETLQEMLPSFQENIDDDIYRRIIAATTDAELRNIISDAATRASGGGLGLDAALNASIIDVMTKTAQQERDILGVYINRSMVVGSTLNQMADFTQMLDDEDALKLASYQVGLGTQEFAIDRSVNFTLQKQFLAELSDELMSFRAGAGVVALEKFLETDIGTVGEDAILNLGRRFGTATAIYENALVTGKYGALDDSLRPVIDALILSGRMTESGDVPKFIEGMIEGISSAGYRTDALDAHMEQLQRFVVGGGSEAMDYLVGNFGATGSHKYASLAKLDDQAKKTAAQADALKRLALASVPQDQILAATPISEEAQRIASYLIDRHKEEMNSVLNQSAKDMSDTERFINSLRKINLGEKVTEDMRLAAERFGITTGELIDAMELVAARRREAFRLTDLDVLGDNGLEMLRQVQAARTIRMRRFYQNMVDAPTMSMLESVADTVKDDSAVDLIRASFDDLVSGGLTGEEALDSMSDIDRTVLKVLDDEASDESKIVRNINATRELDSDVVDAISARTARSVVAPAADDTLGLGLEAAVAGEDYRSLLGDTPFNREFTQTVKNLFEGNKIFRNSVYAAGALIVGSFAYSHFKDRSEDDIQGPPLLPGGSAYEDMYPDRSAQIPEIGTINYNPGVSYKVNLYGDRNSVNSFRSQAMELGNFDMNTTMYSRIPDVGRDPYEEIASSY